MRYNQMGNTGLFVSEHRIEKIAVRQRGIGEGINSQIERVGLAGVDHYVPLISSA